MTTTEIAVGAAVELPEGVFNVVGRWRFSAVGRQWSLYELDDGEGHRQLLARAGETYYRPRWETVEAVPEEAILDLEGARYSLQQQGEARVEHSTAAAHDFWLAQFRYYTAPAKIAVFSHDRRAVHRLLGEELDSQSVRVYEQ